jgi:hypothetical protein
LNIECYKLLSKKFDKLWSFNIYSNNQNSEEFVSKKSFLLKNPYIIEYKENKIIYPSIQDSLLFVFDSLVNAKKWACHGLIYKCNTTKLVKPNTKYVPVDNYIDYWINQKYYKDILDLVSEKEIISTCLILPEGSMMCPCLKLIERVF